MHNLQDSFSHAGYQSSIWGHGLPLKGPLPAMHYPDKTTNDPYKAQAMAVATWKALRERAKIKCGCEAAGKDYIEEADWEKIKEFVRAPAGRRNRELNHEELDRKVKILFP